MFVNEICKSFANLTYMEMIVNKSRSIGIHPAQKLVQKPVKLFCFFGIQPDIASYTCRNILEFILQLPPLSCRTHDYATFIIGSPLKLYIAVRFQLLQNRCKGSGVKEQSFSEFRYRNTFLFPYHHHGDVVGISEFVRLKKRCIATNQLLGTRIQRKTYLILKPELRIISHFSLP